jgi:hypothetical protein
MSSHQTESRKSKTLKTSLGKPESSEVRIDTRKDNLEDYLRNY